MAAPFETAFSIQARKEESTLMAIHYRLQEAIYIKALPDRVTVIFSTEFKEETDKVYGKVFLQVMDVLIDASLLIPIPNLISIFGYL